MRPVATVSETRAREAEVMATTSEATLIQRAATAVARRAAAMVGGGYGRRVVVLAGKGHNGADALWAGVRLRERGARVDVVLVLGEPGDEHGREPLARLRASGSRVSTSAEDAEPWLRAADLVIDGMLGIGARGELRGEPAIAAGLARAAGVPVLAVDVPSGVDAGTGAAAIAVRADVTVTFGALKPGLVTGRGAELAGVVEVAPIGLEPTSEPAIGVLDATDVAALLPVPHGESSKYSRGVVGLVAGGVQYTGAAVLAAGGALRAGAGTVRLHSERAVADAVRAAWPEVVAVVREPAEVSFVDDGKVDAWVVGPGIGTGDDAAAVVRAVLADDRPVLLDADALTIVGREPGVLGGRVAPTVVTPHTGEFERLTGVARPRAEADRIGVAREAARHLGVTVLLKGLATVVATPDGDVRVNPTGTPWLATAGTGDVLSGGIGALLAAGLDPLDAAAAGAWLHGLAARLASDGGPITAGDVVTHWPHAVRRVLASS